MPSIFSVFKNKKRTTFEDVSFLTNSLTGGVGKNVKTILTIDATLSADHSSKIGLTENPLETGGDVVDHIDIKPITLSIKGIMTESPLEIKQALMGSLAGAVGTATSKLSSSLIGHTVTTKLGGMLGELGGDTNRVRRAIETLIGMQTNKQVFAVITKYRVYDNMVLEDLSIPSTNDDSVEFTANLREIRVVNVDTAMIEKTFNSAVAASGVKAKNLGSSKTKDLEEASKTQVKGKSAALVLLESQGITF
jgi:hypothetical protein